MATDVEKRLFKRNVISSFDLYQAKMCAHHILSRGLHSSEDEEDRTLLRCLNTALIVSYIRPFSKNRGSDDVQAKMPKRYLDVLSAKQRELHDELVNMRDQEHAHSDALVSDLTIGTRKVGPSIMAIPIGRDPIAPMSKGQVEEVAEMIQLLRNKLTEEQCRIQDTLDEDVFF